MITFPRNGLSDAAHSPMFPIGKLGVGSIVQFSPNHVRHVREADASVRIGAAPARESYLRPDAILSAARETGAEAIHPGYGFLSENGDFAEAVTSAGLVWIGPPPAAPN